MERQQHRSRAILLHGQANGQEERQGERRSCPDGGWEGLVEERAEDVVTLAELETQSRGVSR